MRKKVWITLLIFALTMASGMSALAGTFDDYWDFEQADGTYAYAFERVLVTMDETWYQNTRVVLKNDGRTASFYHKASYEAYAAEGLDGGRLFTIGASVNTDFQYLPSFRYIGFDEEEAMNYYAELPTDYQGYERDEAIRKEYDELWSGVDDVISGILVKGSAEYRELYGNDDADPDDTAPEVITSGDYDYSVNEDKESVTIVKYSGKEDVIKIPSEIDGYQVSAVGYQAFTYKKMKSVSFPAGIRSIGERSFEYCVISNMLQLPENATVCEDAFSYAELPASVTIPAGAVVEEDAFSYCEEMQELFIGPNAVIKGEAFNHCYDLNRVVCAEGSRLETEAFEYCRKLGEVILCGDVETEDDVFSYCGTIELTQEEAGKYDSLQNPSMADTMSGFVSGAWEGIGDASAALNGGKPLEILGSPVSSNGVTVTLDKASAKKNDNKGYEYAFSGTIENNSEEGIMKVIYTFTLIDEKGEEYRSFSEVFDGIDRALPPHAKVEFSHDGIKWGPQSVPASVKIGIFSVKTEAELPPVHVPQEGEYLYQALGSEKLVNIKAEPPVKLVFHVDQGGYGRTAVFEKGESLDKAVDLFCDIKIGKETNEWVTDNYNWIGLEWADGTSTGISLNLSNLEYYIHSSPHIYELENLGAFWSYAADYLEED